MNQGNVAVQLRQKETLQKRNTGAATKAKSSPFGVALKEKMLYFVLIAIMVSVSGLILTRYALISQYNYEIQKNSAQVVELHQANETLEVKIDQLSNPERIKQIAENQLGMTAQEDAIRNYSRSH